jgi:hypothetical protein
LFYFHFQVSDDDEEEEESGEPGSTLFVKNLNFDTTDESLKQVCLFIDILPKTIEKDATLYHVITIVSDNFKL